VLIAFALALVGAGVDATRGSDLTKVFSVTYVVGCVIAVLLVRHKGLFTAAVQPPLIMVVVVPAAYQYMTKSGTSTKDLALNDAVPLVNRFPLMATATIAVLAIAGLRLVLGRSREAGGRPRATAARGTRTRAGSAPAARAGGRRPAAATKGKPDTVKDKLDRIQSKAGSLKSQATQPKSRDPRGRRPETGGNDWGQQRQGYPDRGQGAARGSGGQRRDPRSDPRYQQLGGGGYPQGGNARQRQNVPQPQSRPLPNARYRSDRDPYER
jgi:hypothetical protein